VTSGGVRPTADIEGCEAAHARLATTLAAVSDDDVRRPSLLPGWTVGHVLTHLARNADSHVRMVEDVARGKVADQYPGGNEQRDGDIEAGSGRAAAALVSDVLDAAARLERAWAAVPDEAWAQGHGRMRSGLWPAVDLPFLRWREVEVHHVDLDLGYGYRDWPDAYVDRELARTLARLPARLPAGAALVIRTTDSGETWTVPERSAAATDVVGERRWLLAWLVGRVTDRSLPALAPWW
jgi:maleylpyruvate isomerase